MSLRRSVVEFICSFKKALGLIDNPAVRVLKRTQSVDISQENNPHWLILRCSRCNEKCIPLVNQREIFPVGRFCKHCGAERYYIERKEDIERLDTIYAIYSKDLEEVRKAVVSNHNITMDRKFKQNYVSQSPENAWQSPDLDFVGNVVSMQKYSKKER